MSEIEKRMSVMVVATVFIGHQTTCLERIRMYVYKNLGDLGRGILNIKHGGFMNTESEIKGKHWKKI